MLTQRSEAWFKIRRSKLTASRFGDILAKPTTKRYQNYMQDVIDGILDIPDFKDEQPWFQHGIEWEDEARRSYEWDNDVEVIQSGFICHLEYPHIGCSSDGEIGANGLLEIKSRKSLKEHQKAEAAKVEKKYLPQIQGELWITNRDWCDYYSYYKSNLTICTHTYRVKRDEEYIKKLKAACLDFWEKIQLKLKGEQP